MDDSVSVERFAMGVDDDAASVLRMIYGSAPTDAIRLEAISALGSTGTIR
jgi:hypothetical protein